MIATWPPHHRVRSQYHHRNDTCCDGHATGARAKMPNSFREALERMWNYIAYVSDYDGYAQFTIHMHLLCILSPCIPTISPF